MSDDVLRRLRQRVDEMEQGDRDLRMLIADQNFEIRKDVHLTMSSIGIGIYDLQKAIEKQNDLLHGMDKRMVRLETWAQTQDEKRAEGAQATNLERRRVWIAIGVLAFVVIVAVALVLTWSAR